MVYVEITDEIDGFLIAEYRPEIETALPGMIKLNPATGERAVIERSPDDEIPNSWHVSHAFIALGRMASENQSSGKVSRLGINPIHHPGKNDRRCSRRRR